MENEISIHRQQAGSLNVGESPIYGVKNMVGERLYKIMFPQHRF